MKARESTNETGTMGSLVGKFGRETKESGMKQEPKMSQANRSLQITRSTSNSNEEGSEQSKGSLAVYLLSLN